MDYQKRTEMEDRTMRFARDVRSFLRKLPEDDNLFGDTFPLLHASASVGTTYIEAGEAPSKKDFLLLIRVCLKEAKQSIFWLRVLDVSKNAALAAERERLEQEATELLRIFCAIVKKVRTKASTAAA